MSKSILMSSIAGIGTGFLAALMLPIVASVVIGAGVFGVFLFSTRQVENELSESTGNAVESTPSTTPAASLSEFSSEEMTSESKYSIDDVLGRLLALNTRIRMAYPAISTQVLTQAEALINNLRTVLPDCHSRYPDNDLTWELDEIVVDFLPGLFDKYTRAKNNESTNASVTEVLGKLNDQVTAISTALQGEETGELSSYTAVLKETMKLRENITL